MEIRRGETGTGAGTGTGADPDLELLARWRAGDRAAGGELFARHYRDVLRFLQHKVRGDADDLLQRTFLACVRFQEQFRAQSSFRTYLFTIARHELCRHLRGLRNAPVDLEEMSIAELVTTPGSRMARAREVEQLRAALEQLPAELQTLLELHYWHDFGPAELAEIFATTAVNIRARLHRARKALRAQMHGALHADTIAPT